MKKGYYYFNQMSKEERANWLLNFNDDFATHMAKHYKNNFMFISESFSWYKSNEGWKYWVEIANRKQRTPKWAFLIACIVLVCAFVCLFLISSSHAKKSEPKRIKLTEKELELVERLVELKQ